jgi:hypothetical protein
MEMLHAMAIKAREEFKPRGRLFHILVIGDTSSFLLVVHWPWEGEEKYL